MESVETKQVVGSRKECCARVENLAPQPTGRADLAILRCRVCGCRHFEATLDKGSLGLKGTKL